jgi:beta-N-acetylhexosaminidase
MRAKDSFRPLRDRLRRPSRALLAALAAAAVVAVALLTVAVRSITGGSGEPARQRAAAPPAPDRPVVRRSFLEEVIPARGGALPGAGASARIAATVKSMTAEDKVAQLMLLGFEGSEPTAPVVRLLRTRPLGGIVIRRANYASREQVTALAGRATLAARRAGGDPPFVWAPQEGGDFSALPDVPPADVAADMQDARAAGREALASGRALSRLNLNGVLGPVVDVGTEAEDDALGARAFSEKPGATALYASATIAAYKRAGVVSAPEHFPGLGAATQPVEDGPASVGLSLAQLRKRDLLPFGTAIKVGAPAIVISNASYATDDFVVPATLSHAVSTDLLRGELGFRGVAIADDLSQPAITTRMSVADAAVHAIQSGSDMVYISGPARGQEAAYRALLAAVRGGQVTRERLDEAVTRILTLKREYGLVRGLRPRTKVPLVVAPPGAAVPPGAVPPGTAVTPGTVPGTTPGAPTQPAPAQPTPAQPSTPPAAPPAP